MLAFDRIWHPILVGMKAADYNATENWTFNTWLQNAYEARSILWTKPFNKTMSSNSFKLWGENTLKINAFWAHLTVWVFLQDKVPKVLPYLSFYCWFQGASTCCRILWPPWHKGHLGHWHTLFVPEKQRETRKKICSTVGECLNTFHKQSFQCESALWHSFLLHSIKKLSQRFGRIHYVLCAHLEVQVSFLYRHGENSSQLSWSTHSPTDSIGIPEFRLDAQSERIS